MRNRSSSVKPTTHSTMPSQPRTYPNLPPWPHFWPQPSQSWPTYTYRNVAYPSQMYSFAGLQGCYGPAIPTQSPDLDHWQSLAHMTYSYPANFDPMMNAALPDGSTSRPEPRSIDASKQALIPDSSNAPTSHGTPPTVEELQLLRVKASRAEEQATRAETDRVMSMATVDELRTQNEALKKQNDQLLQECERFREKMNLSSTLLSKLHKENMLLVNQLKNLVEKGGLVASPDTAQGDDEVTASGEAGFDEPVQQASGECSLSPSPSELSEFCRENDIADTSPEGNDDGANIDVSTLVPSSLRESPFPMTVTMPLTTIRRFRALRANRSAPARMEDATDRRSVRRHCISSNGRIEPIPNMGNSLTGET